ncbi:hypothetical protein QYM36_010109 [Artemia franciscana]|uniref:Uncharacterized protein n=1 Tax=Artemia franciscana TaxID=6661 RepID=A0AA88I4R2_ARTSF|nr:hypothetical protein QYM36_010109 [Artemia franciscana]
MPVNQNNENYTCVASTSSKPGSAPLVPKQPTVPVSSAAFIPKPGSRIYPGCQISNEEECASSYVSCSVSKLEAEKPSQETISSSKDLKAKAASASTNLADTFLLGLTNESQDSDKVFQENEIHNFEFRVPATPTKNIFVNSHSGANAKPTQVCPLVPSLKRKSEDPQEIKVSAAGGMEYSIMKKVTLNGIECKAFVDPGCHKSLLDERIFEALDKRKVKTEPSLAKIRPNGRDSKKFLNPHVCLALNVASVVGGAMSMARLQSKESIVLDPTP